MPTSRLPFVCLAFRATILQKRPSEYYVHYDGLDKRMDEWVPVESVDTVHDPTLPQTLHSGPQTQGATRGKKRNRATEPTTATHSNNASASGPLDHPTTPRDDQGNLLTDRLAPTLGPSLHTRDQTEAAQQHRVLTARRNFDYVNFGQWHIKTWYFSPYPSFDEDAEPPTRPRTTPEGSASTLPGAISDSATAMSLSAGVVAPVSNSIVGAAASTASGDATLWVCDRCFKYMRDGTAWELHKKSCKILHPPGRKVYQRGAHTIWEVDGQAERLYCQNLSLFGKLFIDVKTLFFDTEHFAFYILTDADGDHDHFLAYFSQEKVSYDDYNLACIVTLPPYQKQGYGMLLIEFSYELSRRAGKSGTPERPLSDLGLRSYVTFWIAVLVRFFRTITPAPKQDEQSLPGFGTFAVDTGSATHEAHPPILEAEAEPRASSISASEADPSSNTGATSGLALEHGQPPPRLGECDPSCWAWSSPLLRPSIVDAFGDVSYHSRRESSDLALSGAFHRTVYCSLDDIARATHLRPDDIALALREAGLLAKRRTASEDHRHGQRVPSNPQPALGDMPLEDHNATRSEEVEGDQRNQILPGETQFIITHEMIETIATERRVKPPYLDRAYVLL